MREELLDDRFGFHRVWLEWESARLRSWWAQAEAEVRLGYILGDMLNDRFTDRAVISATLRAVIGAQHRFGLFVNYYHGQDYYNIQFPLTRSLLRAGLSFDFNTASYLFPDWLPLPTFWLAGLLLRDQFQSGWPAAFPPDLAVRHSDDAPAHEPESTTQRPARSRQFLSSLRLFSQRPPPLPAWHSATRARIAKRPELHPVGRI